MKKLTVFAAFTALGLACVPVLTTPALAQSLSYSTIVATDHSMRTSKLIGMDVFNEKGEKIGKIDDILVKGSAAEPMVILSVGEYVGGGSKMVAVPMSHIGMKADKASMPATKATLMAMSAWQFNPLSGGGG